MKGGHEQIRNQEGGKILNDFVRPHDNSTMFSSILVKKIENGGFAPLVGFKQLVHI